MKQFTFFILVIFVCFSVNAQRNDELSDFKMYKDSVVVFNNPVLSSSKYKFLFENEKGKVYESQIDKMRCLVPTFSSKMPVRGTNKINPEPMPNPSRRDSIPLAPGKK